MVLPHRTGALGALGSQVDHQGRLWILRVWTLPEAGGRGPTLCVSDALQTLEFLA